MATLSAIFRAQDQMSRQLSNMAGASNKLESALSSLKKVAVGVFAAAGVTNFVKDSTKAFVDFENGMNEVFTLLPDITEKAMGDMTAQVKKFSKEAGVLPEKTVPALYQALSAGVPKENVFEFLEQANKAAVGGVTNLETAVNGLASVTNSYGRDVISSQKAADLMFTTVKLGITNFEELSNSLYNVLPSASAAGVGFEDVSASLAALTAQKVPTSVATTRIRAAIDELSKAGTKTDKIFRQVAGKSFKEFIAQGGNLQEAFQVLEKEAQRTSLGINDLFGSIEAGGAALALTGKGTDAFTNAMEEMANASGATDAAFGKMEKGLKRKIEKMKANFEVFKLEVGGRVAGALNVAFEAGSKFINFLQVKFAPIIDAVKAKFGQIGAAFSSFTDMIKSGETITHSFWMSFKKMFGEGAAGVIADFIGYFEFGIKGLMAFMRGDLDGAADLFYSMFPDEAATQGKVNAIMTVLTTMKTTFEGIMKAIAPIAEKTFGLVASIFQSKTEFLSGMLPKIAEGFQSIMPKVESIMQTLGGYFEGLMPIVQEFVSGLYNNIKGIVPLIVGVVDKVLGAISNVMPKLVPVTQELVQGIGGTINDLIPIVMSVVTFVADNILPILIDAFQFLGGTVIPTVVGAFSSWLPRIGSIVQNLWTLIQPILNMVVENIKTVFPFIKDVIMGAISSIIGVIDGLLAILDGLIKFITGVFTGDWRKAWEGIKDIFGGIFNTLGALLKVPINAVIALINQAIRGVNKLGIKIPDWVPIIGGKAFNLNIPEMPMLAKGSSSAPDAFIAGEKGPELITGAAGSTVFPKRETDKILSAMNRPLNVSAPSAQAFNPMYEESSMVEEKHITLDINGNGEIKIDKGTSKEEILEILLEYLKPILMSILKQEIFEEGDLSYEF